MRPTTCWQRSPSGQSEQRISVSIVTGDRDAFQLIDEQGLVSVMATARGITETKLYDRAAVIERYGIAPEQIPDFYGLKGDTSDNIPGVPGIGEKTAAELLVSFGTLESLLDRTDEVSGVKRRENLVAHREDAIVSKQLATMQRDLPLEPRSRTCWPPSPTSRRCARRSGATSCATRCAGWRRRSAACRRHIRL